MTQEQKRFAIEAACGLRQLDLNDLNVMHEVENKCIYVDDEAETDLALDYTMNLVIAAPAGRSMNATAAQRAEAIGKTLNLW
jgi:hypothetical protein